MPKLRDPGVAIRVPDSDRSYLLPQLLDLFAAPDWHPNDHPAMPPVVEHGRKPDVFACGFCHLPDGGGRPENSSLAGLPVEYIMQQLADFKSGARRTAVPARLPPQSMISLAKMLTDAEMREAAEYFSRLPLRPRIEVIETATVPGTHVAGWFLAADATAPREPIGRRIIEVPADLDRFEHRDAHSRFVAYVPLGSVAAGGTLVRLGNPERTLACAGCHGADLKGVGIVPGIAGRSPSYIVRRLFDIQSGMHTGPSVAPMQEVVRRLSMDDMIAIAAYLATLR
jgi:cytochrome c553